MSSGLILSHPPTPTVFLPPRRWLRPALAAHSRRLAWRLVLRAFLLAVVATGSVASAASADAEVPYLTGRVNDYADMISMGAESRLDTQLAQLENEKGTQIVVLTIRTLDGYPLEEYSHKVAETWKIGRGDNIDDGALLLIVKNDRKIRIEVGYGLEATLTDVKSRRILDNIIRPRFKAGDFDGGIMAGVDAMERVARGAELLPPSATRGQRGGDEPVTGLIWFAFLVPFIFAIVSGGPQTFVLYLFLMPFVWSGGLMLGGPTMANACLVGWAIGIPIVWWLLRSRYKNRPRRRRRRSGWSSSRGWSTGGWSGGGWSSGGGGWSGGGGGFSGGGGGFGGGGASGGW